MCKQLWQWLFPTKSVVQSPQPISQPHPQNENIGKPEKEFKQQENLAHQQPQQAKTVEVKQSQQTKSVGKPEKNKGNNSNKGKGKGNPHS